MMGWNDMMQQQLIRKIIRESFPERTKLVHLQENHHVMKREYWTKSGSCSPMTSYKINDFLTWFFITPGKRIFGSLLTKASEYDASSREGQKAESYLDYSCSFVGSLRRRRSKFDMKPCEEELVPNQDVSNSYVHYPAQKLLKTPPSESSHINFLVGKACTQP